MWTRPCASIPTYAEVTFGYRNGAGNLLDVKTLEETTYPRHYHTDRHTESVGDAAEPQPQFQPDAPSATVEEPISALQEKHLTFQENQKGVSYDSLFGAYLKGANRIVVTDAYIRTFYQARNFMELLETVVKHKDEDDEIAVHQVGKRDGDTYLLNVMSWTSNDPEGRRTLCDNLHLILDKEELTTPPEVVNALKAFRAVLIKIGGTPSSAKSKAQGARKKSLSRSVTIKVVDVSSY